MHDTLITLTGAEFREIRDLLSELTGLSLRNEKKEDFENLIRERIAARPSDSSLESYLATLRSEGNEGSEIRHLVNRLTVGETYFFRNSHHFESLRYHVFRDLISMRRGKSQYIRVWSAGCATGEEPYSLAMLLLDLIPDLKEEWNVSILATDINREALAAARKGNYREWSFRETEEFYLRRYFTGEGNTWQLSPEVRELVTFRYLNLAEESYPSAINMTDEIDLIVCRNVMIYFNIDLCKRITERFHRSLAEGGYLLVGHSEHSDMIDPKFRRQMLGPAVLYRKEGRGEYWEKGIRPRFRGSGKPTARLITPAGSGFKKKGGVQRPPETEETILFERGVAFFREMKTDQALEVFRKIFAANPGNERAHYMIAMILANAGRIGEAESETLRLIEKNPLHLEAIYLLSMIYRVKGERAKEIAQLKRAVYIDRNFVPGHFQMGVYHLSEGNAHQARRSLQNVLDLIEGKDETHLIDGIDGMTVGRLRKSIPAMIAELAEEN